MYSKRPHPQQPLTNKRATILSAAVELFLSQGYGAASINKLIENIGGSKATVYGYFYNKEGLFEAVVESIVDEVPAFINAIQLEDLELRAGLLIVSRRLLKIATSPRHVALARLVIAETDRFPEVGKIFYHRVPEHICDILTTFVQKCAARDGFKIAHPRETVESFTGMVLHHQLFRQFCLDPTPPSDREISRIAARNTNMLLAMLSLDIDHNKGMRRR